MIDLLILCLLVCLKSFSCAEFKKLGEELQAEKEDKLQLANAYTSFKEQAEETQRLQSEENAKVIGKC